MKNAILLLGLFASSGASSIAAQMDQKPPTEAIDRDLALLFGWCRDINPTKEGWRHPTGKDVMTELAGAASAAGVDRKVLAGRILDVLEDRGSWKLTDNANFSWPIETLNDLVEQAAQAGLALDARRVEALYGHVAEVLTTALEKGVDIGYDGATKYINARAALGAARSAGRPDLIARIEPKARAYADENLKHMVAGGVADANGFNLKKVREDIRQINAFAQDAGLDPAPYVKAVQAATREALKSVMGDIAGEALK